MPENSTLLDRARATALWVLDTDKVPPMEWDGGRIVEITMLGNAFQYIGEGLRGDDNPWNEVNGRTEFHPEGLVLVARCPRHGGSRRSHNITTGPRENKPWAGKVMKCRLCSNEAVSYHGGDISRQYCAVCAKGRFNIPQSEWWAEPKVWPVFTREQLRAPMEADLAATLQWASNVECERCVTMAYHTTGGAGGSIPSMQRTYRRD